MKQITITLPDIDAGKFVQQLLDLNVTFTVTTTVARDPLVFAASERHELTDSHEPTDSESPRGRIRNPPDQRDPDFIQRGLKAAKVGVPTYTRSDRPGRHMQRLTPDGRTSMNVVEATVRKFAGRKFSLEDIRGLSTYSGFQPHTLQAQLQVLVARGEVVKLDKWTYREAPPQVGSLGQREVGQRASPLPENGSVGAPSTASEPTASPEEPATFVTGEGWRAPA